MGKQENGRDRPKNKILTVPNLLSALRICLIPVFARLYLRGDYAGTVAVLLLSGVTDIADGFIARHFHMTSDLGKILDPVADKLTQAVMLLCLVSRFPLMLAPFALMAVKELFMSVTGIMLIRRTGQVLGAEWHGKAATVLLYAMMILHVIWYDIPAPLSALTVCACAAMIVLSLVLYGMRNIRALSGTNGPQERSNGRGDKKA